MPATAPVSEIGYAQNVNYNWWLYENETTPELIWPQSIYVFDQMRRTDAQVASVLRAVMLPVRRTPWRIEPAGARARVVKFVADDLGLPIVGKNPTVAPRLKDRFSWPEHLRQALLMLVFGHMFFEQVYRVDDGGTAAHLRKLAPRPPKTIERIDVAPDGGLIAIKQYWTSTDSEPKPIPVDRLVAYVHDREGGNWLGNSLLRPAYKHWLIKDRLLRVQAQTIERNGMGVPLYKAAETETDLAPGLAMAKSWRAGEAAGSAVPNGADLVLRGVEGDLPDADPAIRYHDEQLARAVLAHFLNLGTQTGSWALGTTFADFFTLSLQTLAQQIADIATQHIVEDLVDVNFGEDEPAPRIVFDEIGSRQAATAQALKALIDAGVIHPDQVLEESSRQQYGLPPADPATATVPAAPAAAPSAAPSAPTQMGDMSVAAAMTDAGSSVQAAAGIDTHPGGEQLKHYWVHGEGAAKWSTWTELYHHLVKYLNPEMAKRTAAEWFHERYGIWPGSDANKARHGHVAAGAVSVEVEDDEADAMSVAAAAMADPKGGTAEAADLDEEADDWEDAIDALIEALAELDGYVEAAFNPKQARIPKGQPGGGRFRSMVDRLKDAIEAHQKGKGDGHPFDGFDREQLRRVAKARGIELKRGEGRDDIARKLLDDLHTGASRKSEPGASRSVRVPGRDRLDEVVRDLHGQPAAYEGRRRKAYDTPYDAHLQKIVKTQGFDAKPQVVTKEHLDQAVKDGWTEVWRGVMGIPGAKRPADINHDLRFGQYEPGRGIYGNGVYTSVRRVSAEVYRGREPVRAAAPGRDFTPDDLDGEAYPDSLLRMAIDPQAKVVNYDDVKPQLQEWRQGVASDSPEALTLSDAGRFAAAKGYDVMLVRGHSDGAFYPGWENSTDDDFTGGIGHPDQYVILNRSVVMIQRAEDVP